LRVIAAQAGQALHVLDRFHITGHLNQAVDQVRRAESTRLRTKSKKAAQRLKHMRWPLLRRGSRVRGRARQKLDALLASKLATARAWDLKETFSYFWKYKSVIWAGGFLDYWCFWAMRSRLEPIKRVARMLRAHEPLILNWFRAKGEISNGAVEGLNNKIRVVTRRSYGFRTYEAMEIARYHNLGRLPGTGISPQILLRRPKSIYPERPSRTHSDIGCLKLRGHCSWKMRYPHASIR
jgi:transposase